MEKALEGSWRTLEMESEESLRGFRILSLEESFKMDTREWLTLCKEVANSNQIIKKQD
jgi:hypothetical protein